MQFPDAYKILPEEAPIEDFEERVARLTEISGLPESLARHYLFIEEGGDDVIEVKEGEV